MRSPDAFLVAGLVSLLGLFGAVLWFGDDGLIARAIHRNTTVAVPVHAEFDRTPKPAHGKASKGLPSHATPSNSRSTMAGLLPPDSATATDRLPLSPQPLFTSRLADFSMAGAAVPESLRRAIGANRSEVRRRYGVPKFEVISSQSGSLVERYYYADKDYTNMAVAILLNGRLVSVENVQY